jgi:hypothetical protein
LPNNDSNKIAARSALLDYYSDKATSFGGFFLASIFGLITMLALIQGIDYRNSSFECFWIGIILNTILAFVYLAYYLMPQSNNLDNTKYFGGYFLATMVAFLSILLILNGIINGTLTMGDFLIGISFTPVISFAYVGYYVIQRFGFYAEIASKIEMGDFTKEGEGLRFDARLDKMLCYIKDETGKFKKIHVSELIAEKTKEQDNLLGKTILGKMRLFQYAYWLLMTLLIIVSYGVHFM